MDPDMTTTHDLLPPRKDASSAHLVPGSAATPAGFGSSAFYSLPDGNVQIAFSGGRSSAYMLHQILEANGGLPDRVEVTFQNTGRESNASLDFVQEVSHRWGVMVTWLEYRPNAPLFEVVGYQGASRDSEPFEALIKRKKYLPNQQSRFCTIELKVRTAKRYLRSIGWDHWTNAVGFRADEPHRLNKPAPKDRWTVWHPMAAAGVSRHDVALFWRKQPFDLQLANINGKTPGGNCRDCMLKSESIIAGYMRDNPEDDWSERMEAWVSAHWYTLGRWPRLRRIIQSDPELATKLREAYGRPISASVIESMTAKPRSAAQFSKRYSRKEVRQMLDRQGDWIFNDEAFLCQSDDGECVA
ncbi:hypothetical protein AB3Y40_06675 [Yoonia sp. R2331]|uniref:hypothetical protein n=1 Tax=Yoonia sp. R2331 TaxID=3237238 RepID=UPI0034E3936A